MSQPTEPLSDRVYVELVRSLYANPAPAVIMTAAFGLTVVLLSLRWPHAQLPVVGGIGILATCVRLVVTQRNRKRALTAPLDRAAAAHLERLFAIPTFSFAVALGAFGATVFRLPAPEAHMLIVSLGVGYCAGVATGVGLRPYVAIPCMAAVIFPVILMGLLQFDIIYGATSAILLAFFAAGTHTILTRCATVKSEIGKRLTFGSLARQDGLTALPNRLALREYFDENASLSAPQRLVAVHYLDLDGFKPVNDRYGHATGDALLSAVAERLNGAIRNGDLVARVGGDEFAVLQFGLQHAEEADLLAMRASAALRQPFRIGAYNIRISASIGTVTTEVRDSDLDRMLDEADRKLYSAKRARSEDVPNAA